MMTDRMREIVQTLKQLPAEAQDELAEQIAAALDGARWQALLYDPERLERLRALADEAMFDEVKPFPRPTDQGHGDEVRWFWIGTYNDYEHITDKS